MNETQCSDQPVVIVITGLPCTGKTTIGERIATQLNIPFLHKDGFKEVLFDSLGCGDRAWSSRLSKASFELLFYSVEANIACGRSVILEGNFREQEHSEQLNRIASVYQCRICQL